MRALAILLLAVLAPAAALGWGTSKMIAAFRRAMDEQLADAQSRGSRRTPSQLAEALSQTSADFRSLADVAAEHRSRHGAYPADAEGLYRAWTAIRPDEEAPLDPFDGKWYGYERDGEHFVLYSTGPDLDSEQDDIVYRSEHH